MLDCILLGRRSLAMVVIFCPRCGCEIVFKADGNNVCFVLDVDVTLRVKVTVFVVCLR